MILKNLFKTEEEIKGALIGTIFADGSIEQKKRIIYYIDLSQIEQIG